MRYRSTLRRLERRTPAPPAPSIITWYSDETGLPTTRFGAGWWIQYDDLGRIIPERSQLPNRPMPFDDDDARNALNASNAALHTSETSAPDSHPNDGST